MHDHLAVAHPLGRDPVERRVLATRGNEGLPHALLLHSEDVYDVGVRDRADVVRHLAAERLDPARDERRRADERRPGVDERERLHERPRDARMENVPDDRDVEAVQAAERLAHRVQVEQGLGRMLMLAVARVHDVCVGQASNELRRADRRMPDDDDVGLVGGERQRRVLERLALVH